MNNFNFVIYCTFMCVDVVRTAGVGLLDTRAFSPVPELSFFPPHTYRGWISRMHLTATRSWPVDWSTWNWITTLGTRTANSCYISLINCCFHCSRGCHLEENNYIICKAKKLSLKNLLLNCSSFDTWWNQKSLGCLFTNLTWASFEERSSSLRTSSSSTSLIFDYRKSTRPIKLNNSGRDRQVIKHVLI